MQLPPQSIEKRQLIARLRADLRQKTGREYAIGYDLLDITSLRELARAVRDVGEERKTGPTPWWRKGMGEF